jgi:hypothetical protein
MTRNAWTTVVVLVAMLSTLPAHAAGKGADAAYGGQLVSLTSTTSPGRTDAIYTVPPRSRLVVTQACVEHEAMDVKLGDNVLTYGREGCTDFSPGFVVAGGQTLGCRNDSGLGRTCAVVGFLEAVPVPKGPRVRFFDLR